MSRNYVEPARPYLRKKLRAKSLRLFYEVEKTNSDFARITRSACAHPGLTQRQVASKAETTPMPRENEKHMPDREIDYSDIPDSSDEELQRGQRVGRIKPSSETDED